MSSSINTLKQVKLKHNSRNRSVNHAIEHNNPLKSLINI